MRTRTCGERTGFTIFELMIVVTIIAIIVAIVVPAVRNSRMSANEAAAISALRIFVTVQEQYHTRFGSYASTLGNLTDADYISGFKNDAILERNGYNYFYLNTAPGYVIQAVPLEPGITGSRYFATSPIGTIHWSSSGPTMLDGAPLD